MFLKSCTNAASSQSSPPTMPTSRPAPPSCEAINGSMRFDPESLQPLFKLDIGPLQFIYLEVAHINGINNDLIKRAKEVGSPNQVGRIFELQKEKHLAKVTDGPKGARTRATEGDHERRENTSTTGPKPSKHWPRTTTMQTAQTAVHRQV